MYAYFLLLVVVCSITPWSVQGDCADSIKECQWLGWGNWTDCTTSCGETGQQTRTRGLCCDIDLSYDECVNKCGVEYSDNQMTQDCGETCYNGGTFGNDSCQCVNSFSGKCCEDAVTMPVTVPITTTTTPMPTTTERRCHTALWDSGIITADRVMSSSNFPGKTAAQAYSSCNHHPCGWCPDPTEHVEGQYIEVTLPRPMLIQAIEIRPPEGERPNSIIRNYMTNYTFRYQPVGGSKFIKYGTEQHGPVYLLGVQGNAVSLTSTVTEINKQITSRFRIVVEAAENHACFRFEIFGCESLCKCENGGSCFSKDNMCLCPPPYYGPNCHYKHLPEVGGCLKPLGMWDSKITDRQIVVSSSAANHGKDKARYICCAGEDNGAWCPASNDTNPYYEIRFAHPMLVAMMIFQQPNVVQYWELPTSYMNTFNLEYRDLATGTVQPWAQDVDAIESATVSFSPIFEPYLFTDVIRILPQTWTKAACFRVEIIGCNPQDGPLGIPAPIGRRRRGIRYN